MRTVGRVAIVGAGLAVLGTAEAGHEPPVYPSYYPQEIRIEPIDPAAAGRALAEGRIQAYLGPLEGLPAGAEESVKFVELLGSWLVVRVNPDPPLAADAGARCALAAQAVSALAGGQEGFRFHPYPVNPLHADYLHHFDLAAQAKSRFGRPAGAGADGLKVRAAGALAERLVRARWTPAAEAWDVAVEEISLDDLLAESRFRLAGWIGPPWLKAGWFHAWLLLAPTLPDIEAQGRAQAMLARLQHGDYRTGEERINLERDLVKLLTGDCRTVVAGYRRTAVVLQRRLFAGCGEHRLRFPRRPPLRDLRPHGQAQGFPVERLAHARGPDRPGGGLEPAWRLHRRDRAPDPADARRPGAVPRALQCAVEPEPDRRRQEGGLVIGGLRRSARAVLLAAIALGAVGWSWGAKAQPQGPVEQVFELRIEGGEVADELRTLRVTEGDRVRLRWTADAPTVLHLHGYDVEQEVVPGRVTEMQLEAYATGRFPIEVHGHGDARLPITRRRWWSWRSIRAEEARGVEDQIGARDRRLLGRGHAARPGHAGPRPRLRPALRSAGAARPSTWRAPGPRSPSPSS